jgi:hypothetical protein
VGSRRHNPQVTRERAAEVTATMLNLSISSLLFTDQS